MRQITDYNGLVYLSLVGGVPVVTTTDKLVTFSTEFLAETVPRGLVEVLQLPDSSRVLRINAKNRTPLYRIVGVGPDGRLYGELEEGFSPV